MKVNPYVKSSDNNTRHFTEQKAASILGITIEELRSAITNTNSQRTSMRVSIRASMRVSNKIYIDTDADATNYANANSICCTTTLC